MCRSALARIWQTGIFFLVGQGGAILAPAVAEEATTVESLHKICIYSDLGTKNKKEGETGDWEATTTPQFSLARSSSTHPKSCEDDLVLSIMPKAESSNGRLLSDLPSTLVKSLDSSQSKEALKKRKCSRQEAWQAEGESGAAGRIRHFSRSGSLDAYYSTDTHSTGQERRRFAGRDSDRASTAAHTSSSTSPSSADLTGIRIHDEPRDQDLGAPTWDEGIEPDALRGTGITPSESRGQRKDDSIIPAFDACPHQQDEQSQSAGGCYGQESACCRQRVDRLHGKGPDQSTTPCIFVSPMSSWTDPSLQFEGRRTQVDQTSTVEGIPVTLGTDRDIGRFDGRGGPGHTNEEPPTSPHGSDARSHSCGFGNGRDPSPRERGRGRGCGVSKGTAKTSFQSATSPHRVANQHLKVKKEQLENKESKDSKEK